MSGTGNITNRKRSRWGAPAAAAAAAVAVAAATTGPSQISDEEALRALQEEAALREQQLQQEQQHERARNNKHNSYNKRFKNYKDGGGGHYGHEKQQQRGERNNSSNSNYYGPSGFSTSDQPDEKDSEKEKKKELPNFAVSGALVAKDTKTTGGMYKGVLLKFQEPPEARTPNTQWRLYVFKGDEQIETLHISKQSAFLLGRLQEICDIVLHHASCSSQHAVLQYRALPTAQGKLVCQPYLMDLESTNGTFLNGVRLDAARYYQLKKGDVLKFGASTREYVLLTANTTSIT